MDPRAASPLDLRMFAALATLAACNTYGPEEGNRPAKDPGAMATAGDAGTADAAAKGERPFAGSLAEATTIINGVLDKKQSDISACVRQYRARAPQHQSKVSVAFGIDQEGKLLGVTSKGKEDAALRACVQEALRDALFPQSHAGVITITKTYEELVQ